jgi:hypothetical protein
MLASFLSSFLSISLFRSGRHLTSHPCVIHLKSKWTNSYIPPPPPPPPPYPSQPTRLKTQRARTKAQDKTSQKANTPSIHPPYPYPYPQIPAQETKKPKTSEKRCIPIQSNPIQSNLRPLAEAEAQAQAQGAAQANGCCVSDNLGGFQCSQDTGGWAFREGSVSATE